MREKPIEVPAFQLLVIKRRIFLVALAAGVVAMFISLVSGQASHTSYDKIVMPGLAFIFIALLIILWRFPRTQGLVEIVLFASATFSILGKLIALSTISPLLRMGEYTELLYWFPLIYLLAFFIFGNRRWMFIASTLILFGAAAIGFLGLDWNRVGEGNEFYFLLRFYLANIAYIFLLGLSTRVNDQYIRLRFVAEEMTGLASEDGLLQIANRRYLEHEIPQEIRKALRYGQPLSAITFDLNDFKKINDTHGHLTGDEVLIRTANIVKSIVRTSDLFGRWGGDEFLILLPHTNGHNAKKLAERMHDGIATIKFEPAFAISASFGVAEYQPHEPPQEWLKRADEALYAAKRKH